MGVLAAGMCQGGPGGPQGQMSRQSWIRAPGGGCLASVIAGYLATACRRVPWNQGGRRAGLVTCEDYQVLERPAVSRAICRSRGWSRYGARSLHGGGATVTGGRANGHGRTTDGALDVQLRSPAEMGGAGGGTNPEQLFAVGYAACFEGALGVVGRRERVEVGDVSIDSRVSLLPTEERGFKLAVELDVTLPQVQDPEQAARIVAAAHQVCPYSNATRGNIDVTLTANGRGIG